MSGVSGASGASGGCGPAAADLATNTAHPSSPAVATMANKLAVSNCATSAGITRMGNTVLLWEL